MPEHAAVRSRTAPIHPRRVSGPARRLAPAAPIPRGRTGAFEKLSRLPDHRVVDRVLRSRGCIWLIGILLGGIVAMQVSLLRLNSGISRAVQTQSTLEKQNMALQSSIAELTSSDRVVNGAAQGQMIDPPAGQTRYLTARPDSDPARAARRYKPPSERAKLIMQYHGILPGSLAAPGTAAAQLVASLGNGTNGTTAAAGTTTPAGANPQASPAATPIPTPIATAVPTTTPPATTTDPAGAATAPQG
jgi:hypothetical protein